MCISFLVDTCLDSSRMAENMPMIAARKTAYDFAKLVSIFGLE